MTTPVYDSVAYLAADKFAVFNPAGDSFVGEFAPGARLRADCGTDGVLLGTVAAASFEAATGRTVVTTAMDGGAALTANLAEVLHGNDLPTSLCAHASLHAIGGRDALPAASTGVSGLASLATAAETQAGTTAAKAVTPAGLAASAKGLIAASTTIYVATTGSDTTGTGASGAPYASIAKALSSIANKLIASGVTVTIQVADGTYTVSSAIVIDHPDADKIRILGNVSAETAITIASIDTVNKKFVASGNYTATAGFSNGDRIVVTGSSTAGLNRSYTISGAPVFSGGNTEITVSESIASSTVGGAVITAKPCNKCVLNTTGNIVTFKIAKSLGQLAGFRLNGPGIASGQAIQPSLSAYTILYKMIISGYSFGLSSLTSAYTDVQDSLFHGCGYGIFTQGFAKVSCNAGTKVMCDACNYGVTAVAGGKNIVPASVMTMANAAVADYSPAATGTTNQTISGAMNIPSATV